MIRHTLIALGVIVAGTFSLALGNYGPAGYQGRGYNPGYFQKNRVHHGTEVIFADAFFPTFDFNVRDLFIFTGRPTAQVIQQASVPAAQPQPVPLQPPAAPRGARLRELARQAEEVEVNGYEEGAKILKPTDAGVPAGTSGQVKSGELAFLGPACARCHGDQKQRGGVRLFVGDRLKEDVDWKAVADYATSTDPKVRPKCPPSGDALTPEQAAVVRRKAGL